MQRVLAGGAVLGDRNGVGDERTVACRPLSAVEVRSKQPVVGLTQQEKQKPGPSSPKYLKRCQCRRYGCWGRLAPMKRDRMGRDLKCVDCGCPDWSDPRKL
jgi:hypothetical protein